MSSILSQSETSISGNAIINSQWETSIPGDASGDISRVWYIRVFLNMFTYQGLPLSLTVYRWNQMNPLESIWFHLYTVKVTDM